MNRIRELREERGWTMDELAARVRPATTASQVNKLEKGQRRLTFDWMERLAAAFGCAAHDLIHDGGEALSYQERQLLEAFRGLSDSEQQAFLHTAESFAGLTSDKKQD